MDAGGPAGSSAVTLRAPHHIGLLSDAATPSAPDSRQHAQGHPWGFTDAVLGFAAGLIISVLTAGIAESVTGYKPSAGGAIPVAVIAANVGGLWIGLTGAAIYASRRKGTGSLRRDFGLGGRWWDLPVGGAIGLASQYGLVPLLYLPFRPFDRSLNQQLSRPVHQDTGDVHTVAAASAVFVLLALGAPLVEELFFRGLLLRSLLGRIPVPAAIGLSAVLFALAHFQAIQFAGLAVFGVVLGVLAWWTGRLAPSIAAHIAFNAAAVVAVVQLS